MMTLREFAKREGFTKAQALDLAERGLLLGAECNPFSKQWRIAAPACLVDWLAGLDKPATERVSQGAARSPRAGVMGAAHADTHPAPVGLAELLLSLEDQQAPQACAAGLGFAEPDDAAAALCADGASADSDAMPVFGSAKVRGYCRSIKAAVLKQDPSTHRLALDDSEFLHLFYAIERVRSKTRKDIGKGKAEIGDLRCTDSLWHKLQTIMAHRQWGAR
jgi:hypothetical protein